MHDTSTLETLGDHCRRLSVVVVTICCAGTVAACGSSSKSETTIASNGNSQGIKFAACSEPRGRRAQTGGSVGDRGDVRNDDPEQVGDGGEAGNLERLGRYDASRSR